MPNQKSDKEAVLIKEKFTRNTLQKKAVLTTLKNKKIYLTNSFFIAIKITFFYN